MVQDQLHDYLARSIAVIGADVAVAHWQPELSVPVICMRQPTAPEYVVPLLQDQVNHGYPGPSVDRSFQRLRTASAKCCRPPAVLGTVERPPCIRQRPLGKAGAMHGVPFRVRAPHRSRSISISRHSSGK